MVVAPLDQDKILLNAQLGNASAPVRDLLQRLIAAIGGADNRNGVIAGRYAPNVLATAAVIWRGFRNLNGLLVLTYFWTPGGGAAKVKARGKYDEENAVFCCRKAGHNETWIHIKPFKKK